MTGMETVFRAASWGSLWALAATIQGFSLSASSGIRALQQDHPRRDLMPGMWDGPERALPGPSTT